MPSLRLSLSLSLLVALASCDHHDCASGNDAVVTGTWTVEGAAPTAASCDEVGIDTVRLGVYCGGNPTYLARLEAPCVDGHLDSVTPVLAVGTYDVAWEGLQAGVRVAQGERHQLVASANGHATVPVVDFVSGYDPTGTDATVSAHWTIDGAAPTDAACSALGITRVRIAAFHGTRTIEIASLTALCPLGRIDTGSMAVLAAGDVVLQLQALGSHQEVLFHGDMTTVHVAAGPTHVALYDDVPVDFASGGFNPHGTDASAGFSWTLDHQMPSIEICDAVGASNAALVLYASDDTALAHPVTIAQAACHFGSYDTGTTNVLRAGSYLAQVQLRGPTDTTLASALASATPLTVTAGTPFDVPAVDVSFPTTLAVTLDWEDPIMGTATTCMGAGVDTMDYVLSDSTSGAPIAMQTGIPCGTRIALDASTTPGLVAGTYDLSVHGWGMTHSWHTTAPVCRGITITDGSITAETCLVGSP